MQIAIIIDDYLPNSTRVSSKMMHELAVLLKQQHKVTVITPDSMVKRLQIDELDGVTIWRFKSGPIKDVGKVQRAINESLLSFKGWQAIKHKVNKDTFDAIIYYSPSIFFGGLVKKIKRVCACPAYLVLRDMFPQWAIDAGILKEGSLIDKYFRFFERHSYKQANMIGLMSEKNLQLFNQYTNNYYSSEILRNWARLIPHQVKPNRMGIRDKLNLHDKVIFFYGGNIGHAQDMANLMRLTQGMQSYKNAHFLYIGQGDEVDLINQLAEEWGLTNFSFLPSVSQEEYKNILTEVDIGLFSLAKEHKAHNFPGKLLGYMVQSLPILGSVNPGNDLMPLVNEAKAGLVTINGDDLTLLKNAIALYQNEQLRTKIGSNSYTLLKKEFDVEQVAQQILSAFK